MTAPVSETIDFGKTISTDSWDNSEVFDVDETTTWYCRFMRNFRKFSALIKSAGRRVVSGSADGKLE
jgi:hypothetical protein